MNVIKIENLKPDMAFTHDVFFEGDSLLVPAKLPIKAKDLKRLKDWGITEVQTEGSEYTPEKAGMESSSPQTGEDSPVQDQIKSRYNAGVINLLSLYLGVENNKKVEGKSFKEILGALLPGVLENPEVWMNTALESPREQENPAQSAVNTMIYAVSIALKLGMKEKEVEELAMAALLHDVGMLRIPDSIKKKIGALTSQELEKIKTHTLFSYRYITSELGLDDRIGRIALLHHERWDGKGYPRQLAEKQIPLASRILSVADAFEAMVRDKPYRDSMIGYTAIRQILNDNSRRFDSEIIKVFIKSMGIYPVGSYVILNDGSVGIVSRIHQDAPLRPVVRILVNSQGKKVEKEQVNLLEKSESFIARPFNPRDLKKKGK